MQLKKLSITLITSGIVTLFIAGLALATPQPAQAQCGSQASSCKSCHEVQGLDPVNADGTDWHQSHAFGDFCSLCHGGNQQATDQELAHTGMAAPLADVEVACQQCHPNDLQARAKVYALALGVEIGAPAEKTPAPTAAPTEETPVTAAEPSAPLQAGLLPNDPNLVDYIQRYNENALGQSPVNWGDVILLVMIAAMLLGGGALVLHNEKLVVVSFKETRPVEGQYPADVVDMVPALVRLKPAARQSLRRLLGKPEAAAELLSSLDKLTLIDSSKDKDDSPITDEKA